MTTRRIAWAVGVVVVLTAAGVMILAWFLTGEFGGGAYPDEALEQEVHALFAQAEPGEVVVLADATDFEWDAVGVFGPYHPREGILEKIEVDVPVSVTNWTDFEGSCLLVFRAGDRMAAWTLVERDVADCSGRSNGRVFNRDQARFRAGSFSPAP